MARRYKSLGHNLSNANPYTPWHTKVSPFHREHRSKKGREFHIRYADYVDYKRKKEQLKIQELEQDENEIINN